MSFAQGKGGGKRPSSVLPEEMVMGNFHTKKGIQMTRGKKHEKAHLSGIYNAHNPFPVSYNPSQNLSRTMIEHL